MCVEDATPPRRRRRRVSSTTASESSPPRHVRKAAADRRRRASSMCVEDVTPACELGGRGPLRPHRQRVESYPVTAAKLPTATPYAPFMRGGRDAPRRSAPSGRSRHHRQRLGVIPRHVRKAAAAGAAARPTARGGRDAARGARRRRPSVPTASDSEARRHVGVAAAAGDAMPIHVRGGRDAAATLGAAGSLTSTTASEPEAG